jgi:hypothetical protein
VAGPYQSQLAPGGTPTFSGASPEDAGAAVGRGLEQAGDTLDRAIHQHRELERDQQAAEAGTQLAQISTQLDQTAIDARNNAAPGAAGHADAIAKAVDEQSAQALGNIKDPRIRARFQQNYAQLKDQIVTREYGWEAAKRVNYMAQNVDDTGTTLANGQAANPDPVGFETSLNTIHTTVDAMQGIDADQKAKLIKEQQRKVAVAWGNSMADKDPRTLLHALDSGLISPYLEPEDIKSLRNGGQVEIRRQEAEARAQLSHDKALTTEGIDVIGKRVTELNDYNVTDAEFDAATAAAKKYGLEGKVIDLANWRDLRDVNRETRTWTPAQWHNQINDLQAKGDNRTPAESLRLKHLSDLAGGAISQFNSDPFAAAAKAGTPAPALDLSNPDPSAVQQRVTWARAFAASSGLQNVPYLSPDEQKVFSDRIKQGPAGQLDATAALRQTFGGNIATAIVKQIDPTNKDIQLMVGLHPRVAEIYKRGVEALKDKTVHLGANDQSQGQADAQALTDIFETYKSGIPVDMQGAVLNAARNITAGTAAEFGKSNPSGDELANAFRSAVQRAGGMLGSPGQGSATGGFVKWYGSYAWLPQDMSRDDFQRRMSRAGPADWTKAAGAAPYYSLPDGKRVAMSESMIRHLPEYRLETVSPGVYRLTGPDGGHVVTKDNRPWQFDIRNLR